MDHLHAHAYMLESITATAVTTYGYVQAQAPPSLPSTNREDLLLMRDFVK